MIKTEYKLTDIAKFACSKDHVFVGAVGDALDGKITCPVCAGVKYYTCKDADEGGKGQTLYFTA
jgi:hypothetical protein